MPAGVFNGIGSNSSDESSAAIYSYFYSKMKAVCQHVGEAAWSLCITMHHRVVILVHITIGSSLLRKRTRRAAVGMYDQVRELRTSMIGYDVRAAHSSTYVSQNEYRRHPRVRTKYVNL